MRLTRRAFSLLAAAGLAAPGVALAEPIPPAIIAEGGSAEERIEDTHGALDLAINQGCDFLQVDVVPSKEGALVARRDNELSASTDVAARSEFAARKTTKTIDGADVTGWFAEDFTADELKTLLCREAQPKLRPQNVKLAGKEPVLDLAQVLQIARDGCVRTARTIGVCVRLLRPAYFAGQGLYLASRLASDLTTLGYASPAAAVWVQASEPDALKTFGQLSKVRRMLVIDRPTGGGPATVPTLTDVATYAEAIAPDQDLLLDPAAAIFPAPTTLALDAHSAGLKVFSRTARAENAFLPQLLRKGDKRSSAYDGQRGDVDKLLIALFADRVDGVATDVPDAAVRARKAVADAIAEAQRKRG
ncbi:MAG TPA: glycerophosphodiester phosphodiesterase family protein [Caulobacteraceae bacterium]|nr:glycerophosphodiester phosphodiesterase family protein [Caulobacteraceae bacterium]